jgi:tRNA(Ile)-lysidine synthase
MERSLSALEAFTDLPWYCALSGGMDSVVLLDALQKRFPGKIEMVIHINHQLQPQSNEWEEFCQSLAESYGLRFEAHRLTLSDASENSAREGRYRIFDHYLETPCILLMAHHADDQVETVLWRALRGTPLQGLVGIAGERLNKQGIIVRPFLQIPHAVLIDYAEQHSLTWCLDPTNHQTGYTRNFLRNDVIPLIEKRMPQLKKQLLVTQRFLQHNHQTLMSLLQPYFLSGRRLSYQAYLDQTQSGLVTLISYWLTYLQHPHPSLDSLELFVQQLLEEKKPQLYLKGSLLIVHHRVIELIDEAVLQAIGPESQYVQLDQFPFNWGRVRINLDAKLSFNGVEIRRLTKHDTVILASGQRMSAQDFWKKEQIAAWERRWLVAFFVGKVFLQYDNYCYNGRLFDRQPFTVE